MAKINYIQKIEILDLWERFNIVWELNPDVNILAGINGSGKTTILECTAGLITEASVPESFSGMVKEIKLFFDNGKYIHHEYIRVNDSIRNLERKAQKNSKYRAIVSDIKEREGKDYKKIQSIDFERQTTSFKDLKMTLSEFKEELNNHRLKPVGLNNGLKVRIRVA
ncbi:MAG: AAA family ATPase [Methylobacter sp.]